MGGKEGVSKLSSCKHREGGSGRARKVIRGL